MLYKIMHVMIPQIQICDSALLIVSENVVPKQSPEIKREKKPEHFPSVLTLDVFIFQAEVIAKDMQ